MFVVLLLIPSLLCRLTSTFKNFLKSLKNSCFCDSFMNSSHVDPQWASGLGLLLILSFHKLTIKHLFNVFIKPFSLDLFNILGFLYFLGGLSLHLNHLIQSRMEISYRLFGTLPIGLLLSNLDSRQLKTSPMTPYDQFWNMSTFGYSRAVWVLWAKS